MNNINTLECPIASILDFSLSATIVKDKNNDKEQFWLKNFLSVNDVEKLPLGSSDLSQKIKGNAILKNSLKGVGIVDNIKTAFELQSQLKHGQSLTTPKGGVWRWMGMLNYLRQRIALQIN